MDTIKLSPDALEGLGLEELGRMLKQLPPLEMAYYCGMIRGAADVHNKQAEQKEGA